MRKSRSSETQIVGILRDAESGVPVPDLLGASAINCCYPTLISF